MPTFNPATFPSHSQLRPSSSQQFLQDFTTFREIGTTIEMFPLSPSDCLVLARHVIGEAVIDAHPEADLLPEGSDIVLHEKSGGGNPLFVRNIAIVSLDM